MAKLAPPNRLENAERNAHARMRGLFGNEITPYPLMLTVADEGGNTSREEVYCFAPYEVFAELYRHPDQWKLSMQGPRGDTAAGWFWDHVKTYRSDHHIFQDQNWAEYITSTIPMDFHSDGVEIYSGTEFLVFSWSSAMVCDITSYDLQMPILIIEKQKYIPGVTDVQIVNFIKWNIDVLESGNHPSLNHDGEKFDNSSFRYDRQCQPLAGGWFA
eukprot:9495341-Pyramimonas_sp.AAC.1